MTSNSNHSPILKIDIFQYFVGEFVRFFRHTKQCINYGISCNNNIFARYSFSQQIPFVYFRRRKMNICQMSRKYSIHFLRIRRILIVCSKSGFDMSYLYLLIKSCKCGSKCRRCVAVNKHYVGHFFFKYPLKSKQNI